MQAVVIQMLASAVDSNLVTPFATLLGVSLLPEAETISLLSKLGLSYFPVYLHMMLSKKKKQYNCCSIPLGHLA